jgi:hypothetical protein
MRCGDGGSMVKIDGTGTGTGTDTIGDADMRRKPESLLGEWYRVGSTDIMGTRVVFTDSTVTEWSYASNYVDGAGKVWNWSEALVFNDAKYLVDDDTLVVFNHSVPGFNHANPFKTHFKLNADGSLFIQYFRFGEEDVPFPLNAGSIILYKKCSVVDDTDINSVLGEWYELGSTDNRGKNVVFTNSTVTMVEYFSNYEHGWGMVWSGENKLFDDVEYLVDGDTLILFNNPEDRSHPFKTQFKFYANGTLFIHYFVYGGSTILYRKEV